MKKAVVERRSRLLYLSMRRREKIRKAIMDKRMEIQRHIRHRMYILNKMKRLAHTVSNNFMWNQPDKVK